MSDPRPDSTVPPRHAAAGPVAGARRGVLLLVVLSMLTLFMMLGAAYIVTATRAREAARAYSRLTFAGDEARVPYARLLDAVLLRVVRGGAAPTAPGGPPTSFEALLADKYGTSSPLSSTATSFVMVPASGTSAAVMQGTLTFSGAAPRPTDLNGRLLTLCEPGRPVTTHRIIRAQAVGSTTNNTASQFTVAIDTASRPGPTTGPKTTTRAIVNGREFDGSAGNESWDGFDGSNVFLAQVQPGPTISTSTVARFSYIPSLNSSLLASGTDYDNDLIPDAADNDNDGVFDGIFLDFGIPDSRDANGNAVNIRASVLVVDLDSRFNVNAHDSLPRLIYAGTTNWPTTISQTVPMGSGYGPAEVNGLSGSRVWTSGSAWTSGTGLFSGASSAALQMGTTFGTSENPTAFTMIGGPSTRMIGVRSGLAGSRYTAGQSTPAIPGVEGRYGERAPSSWSNVVPRDLAGPSSASCPVPGQPDLDDEPSRLNDRRVAPSIASATGFGIPPVWWSGASFNWGVSPTVSGSTQPLPRGIFNSPPDLHGRMRTFTGPTPATVPQLMFTKAEWAGTAGSDSRESKDDPYELRLDTRRGFGGLLFDPTTGGSGTSSSSRFRDNPYTIADLESILRPYDIDSNRVASRLPAMLGSVSEESRLKVTTDSWDTTAITGAAAMQLTTWLAATTGTLYGSDSARGIIGGEVARGERFDLNRPLAAADTSNPGYAATSVYALQRQAYCKDLYTLLMALNNSVAPAELAQWAANVAEFRDADSRVVPFEYDTNPTNGWDVDGDVTSTADASHPDRAVAWGAERPEVVIQEALAWRNTTSGSAGMTITLHRPWNAMAYSGTANAAIAAEPCDYALDWLSSGSSGTPQNILNLGKKPRGDLYSGTYSGFTDVSETTYPIWRLRIVSGGSTRYVRFDTNIAAPGEFADPTVTSGSLTLRLGVDSTVTLLSGSTIVTGSAVATGSVTLNVAAAGASRVMPSLRVPGSANTATLYLERLSDPTQVLTPNGTIPGTSITGSAVWSGSASNTAAVQYIVVDSATVAVNETSGGINFDGTRARRATRGASTDFWRTPTPDPVAASSGGTLAIGSPLASGSTAWFPWPNRPFISSAELLLVPQGTALEILQNYTRPSPALAGAVGFGRSVPVPTQLMFDAAHVPSRFAAIHRTFTPDLSGATGIHNAVTTVNQLSAFREPGRVNLNTVVSDDVWNAVVAGQLSAPVQSRAAASLASSPAQNLAATLALAGGGSGTVISDVTSAQLAVNLNPLHQIYTATRLANTTTPRSNVFAVWITLRESVPNDPDSVKYRRAFYIVDRSIPVGFEVGSDHNVWDCVRLRRIIE